MNKRRNTVQRQIIIDTLKKLNNHPPVEEIYAAIHAEHPSISKTTVYRNLRKLAVDGLIRPVLLPDGLERYDDRTDRHYHFKCKECRDILDVDIDYLADLNDTVRGKYGVRIDSHDVVFWGICLKCKDIV